MSINTQKIILFFKRDINFFSLLLLLLPISLILGPAIPDIILSLIALYFLIISFKYKLIDYYKNYFVIGFMIFCLYGILRSLFSELPWYSLSEKGAIFYFRYIFFALGLKYLLDKNKNLIRYFIYVTLVCLVVLTLDSFFQVTTGKNILGNAPTSLSRVTSLMYDNEAVLGRYVAFLSSILITLWFLINKHVKYGNFYLIFIPLSIVVVIISGDRAPLLRYLIFILLFAFIIPRYHKTYLVMIFSSICLIFLIILNIPSAKERIIKQTFEQMKDKNSILLAPYNRVYEELFANALIIGKNNLIFGIGPNLFEKNCIEVNMSAKKPNLCQAHPHNFYLQIFSEQGLIGLFQIIIFYLSLIYIFMKNYLLMLKKKIGEQICFKNNSIILVLICFIFPFIPNMSFYNNWNNVFLYIMVGLLFHLNSNLFKKQTNKLKI